MNKRSMHKKVQVTCDCCGKSFEDYYSNVKRHKKHYCNKVCEAQDKAYHNTVDQWKGGCISKSNGYRYVMLDGKQIEEHRLVMQRHIGRPLESWEHVHHKNGNKLDNSIENLELTTRWTHPHHHRTGRMCVCRMCGEEKENHGRGLCGTCYHRAFVDGRLDEYESGTKEQISKHQSNT